MRVKTPVRTLALVSACAALVAVLSVGCSSEQPPDSTPPDPKPAVGTSEPAGDGKVPADGTGLEPSADLAWLSTTLTDVKTGRTFKISDFKGRPVFVKTFAVW